MTGRCPQPGPHVGVTGLMLMLAGMGFLTRVPEVRAGGDRQTVQIGFICNCPRFRSNGRFHSVAMFFASKAPLGVWGGAE